MNEYQRTVQQWNISAEQWAANKEHPLKRRFYWYKMKAAAKKMGQLRGKQ